MGVQSLYLYSVYEHIIILGLSCFLRKYIYIYLATPGLHCGM